MRKLIAATVLTGTLALGAAGAAGASTPTSATSSSSTGTSPTTSHPHLCARAEKLAGRIQTREAKAAAWIPKAQAREAKASAAGHTKVATAISKRITRVQKLEQKGTTLLGKIQAKCGSATSGS